MKTLIALLCSFFLGISALQAQWANYPDPLFSNSYLQSVQVLDANNIWAVSGGLNVVKTTNGGQSWTAMPINDPTMVDYFIVSLAVIDQNTAWITATKKVSYPGKPRIYKTTNGGSTWQHQSTAYSAATTYEQRTCANYFFDANNGVNIGEKHFPIPGSQGYHSAVEILTTIDGGANWTEVPPANMPAPVLNEAVYQRSFSVIGDTIWLVAHSGGKVNVYRSSDKGHSWTRLDPGLPNQTGLVYFAIAFADASNGIVTDRYNIRRTTDGGNTWTTVNTTGTWNAFEIAHVTGTASTYISGAGLFYPDRGSYISHNHGATWTTLETTNRHFDFNFKNPTTGWSGSENMMLKFNATSLGIKTEIANLNSFLIYPNPAKGIFKVTPASNKPFSMEIYDLLGNKIKAQKGSAFGQNVIDLSGNAKGV